MNLDKIWIFSGAGGNFPSGVFLDFEEAKGWIARNRLTGVLTLYPINIGVYEWAIEKQFFDPIKDAQKTPEFIGRFSCASMEHLHFEDGKEE
ncbi:hypothetical protein ACFQ3P_04410 [Paraburkholderia sabiae]|uniref:DUF7710 domain-containing protein n=1 Tax=Paraburkholderia sabiae TaxID=273251 RepID=A0ABU9QMI9_9BURK|nr:hypothetical protein [Paraburkholderia sabiae]WJZ79111.1 hypothetical protein QEN71_34620 [Paraburkholderia sabiae]